MGYRSVSEGKCKKGLVSGDNFYWKCLFICEVEGSLEYKLKFPFTCRGRRLSYLNSTEKIGASNLLPLKEEIGITLNWAVSGICPAREVKLTPSRLDCITTLPRSRGSVVQSPISNNWENNCSFNNTSDCLTNQALNS